jgi:hypothetical protein
LCEEAFERAMQFRADRYAPRIAAFAFEEAGWEGDAAADLALLHDVAHCERQYFGNSKPEEHLRRNEGAVAWAGTTNVSKEGSFFDCSERT